MATRAELEQQLATIQAGLLDFTAVGEEAFLKQTGQTKLTKKEIPRYTDVYNPEFEMRKNTTFNVGSDIKTRKSGDFAFYVADPAIEAERAAKEKIQTIESFNLQVETQEQQIKNFLAGQQQVAKEAVLQKYLSGILNPVVKGNAINPFEWESVDLNTNEGFIRWRNTPRQMQMATPLYDRGRQTNIYQYKIKLTPEQIAEKKKTTEAIERIRFMSSPLLQKTYADIYAKELQTSIKTMLEQERKAQTKAQKIQKEIDKLKAKLPK